MTVYCDWSGHISRSYNMNTKDSNMLMLDRKGVIRYRFSGKIDTNRFEDIRNVLDKLVHEEK